MYGGLHALVPPSRIVAPDLLLTIAHVFTPRVELLDPALALLDLAGLGRSWPAPRALGQAIVDTGAARGLQSGVALSWSRVAAVVLARAHHGVTVVPPGAEAAALAPLPLDLLELTPERHELFRRWGLRTLGELAALPALGLAQRLGPEGARLRRLARGEDDRPLLPARADESFTCRLELDWPVDGLEPLAFLLGRVLEPLCESLRGRGRKAAALTLDLHLVDGRSHQRALRPSAPSAEPRTWRTLLLLDLESHPPGEAIQAIALRAEPTAARTVQFSLLDPAQPSPERLAETMARLHEWTAAGRGGAAALLDTHRPGAFVMGSFAPGPARPASVGRVGGHLVLRCFRPPLPARVALREDAPVLVAAAGVRGPVVDRAGPWRSSGDWWDVGWSREEWDVALADGGLYRIYRDPLREQWFVAGELD